MPYLFNTINASTVDELRFYNFISNQYYAGVPTALVPNVPRTESLPATPGVWTNSRMFDWLSTYAFDSLYTAGTGAARYFYFPSVVGRPTANEAITGQCSTSSNYRFYIYRNYYEGTINANDHDIGMNAYSSGAITNSWYALNTGVDSTGQTSYNLFNFGVKSDTTYVELGFRTANTTGDYLTAMNRCILTVQGWLHDGIYSSPPVNEAYRYNNAFMMYVYWNAFTTNYSDFGGRALSAIQTANVRTLTRRHREIACQSGSYSPGLFLSDLILYEDDFTLKYRPVGKVDNRVICLGRGNFVPGRVYRITNPFGRTGTEDWLCVTYFVPSSYSFNAWTPGTDPDYISAWGINEEDRIMVRVYTEGD